MSLLDVLTEKKEEVFSGELWKDFPRLNNGAYVQTNEVPQAFTYDIISDSDQSFSKMLGNLENNKTVATIKTKDRIAVEIGYYVKTQDGYIWQVDGVVTKAYDKSKQTARFLRQATDQAIFMRLVRVDNLLDI